MPELVPIRHGRMLVTPFTFYRGAALPMAADLSRVPSSGLRVQLCGDAHLSNFGVFGAPDRRLVFDLNDFDETLPGPFEWDVKRFAASLAVAGRDIGLDAKDRKALVLAAARAYRESMAEFADKKLLEVWYARLDVDEGLERLRAKVGEEALGRARKAMAKARTRDSMQVLKKLTTVVDGQRRINSNPPLVVPVEELTDRHSADEIMAGWGRSSPSTAAPSAPTAVTSLGSSAWSGSRARSSGSAASAPGPGSCCSRPTAGRSPCSCRPRRPSAPCSPTTAAPASTATRASGSSPASTSCRPRATSSWAGSGSSPGWTGSSATSTCASCATGSTPRVIEEMVLPGLVAYAELCGWTLARAHARSGDRYAISGYLGKTDKFDRAMAKFAERYADRTEQDHSALAAAVTDGRIEAVTGL